jgi:NAD(P)-dependent dehydrogenase (short-subunit alcohol dehydrogenase family)
MTIRRKVIPLWRSTQERIMQSEYKNGDLSILRGYERLKGRVAMVVGAGSVGPGWGNGKATAVAYAREGADVICLDRNLTAAQETAGIIESEGGNAIALACDVIDEFSIVACVSEALDHFGRIDILHNNVGIAEPGGILHESATCFSRVLEVNLRGAFLTMQHVLPSMIERRSGVITNVASVAAVRPATTPYSSYYASKAGLCHLSRTTAFEYAPQGVRVNCILPGFMDTPMVRNHSDIVKAYGGDLESMRKIRDKLVPMGFMGTAWDVAWAAVFLASDEARYITGINLPVDGGVNAS